MIDREYEHTGAPPCRGYKGRRVRVVYVGKTHVLYRITRQIPGYRLIDRVWRHERERFLAQYAEVTP